VHGHIELRTTFIDGTTSRTANIRYLVVNTPSAYNILLGRPALNRIGAIASTRHMKMKLPSFKGTVITNKSDQKEAKKCYENNLKMKRGVFVVTIQPLREEGVTRAKIARICRRCVGEGDRWKDVQAWQVFGPRDLGPDRQSHSTAPGRICLVFLRHA